MNVHDVATGVIAEHDVGDAHLLHSTHGCHDGS